MNLLDRAKKFIQGGTPPLAKTQYYRVYCAEGHLLSGSRNEGYQALRCPTCGEGVFILPRSPLPEPAAPPTPKRIPKPIITGMPSRHDEPVALTDHVSSGEVTASGPEPEIEWVDEAASPANRAPADVPVPDWEEPGEGAADGLAARGGGQSRAPGSSGAPSTRRPSKAAGSPRPVPTARPAPAPIPEPVALPAVPAEPFDLRAWAARRRNALIFVGVVAVVLAAVASGIRQANRAGMPEAARLGRTEGLVALDEGRFDTAYQLLSRAKHAVEVLNDRVEGAAEIRQAADEAAIFARLSPEPLEVILEKAAATDPKEWPGEFATYFRGRAVIIDASVLRVDQGPDGPRYELDYTVLPPGPAQGGKPPTIGRIDTRGLKLFEVLKPRAGDKLLFGARLASFEFEGSIDGWRIGLEPDGAVQMTHRKALEAMGWPAQETPVAEERP